jgi:hypothetical protein
VGAISKQGDRLLRSLLVEAAQVAGPSLGEVPRLARDFGVRL